MSNKRRRCSSKLAVYRHNVRKTKEWNAVLDEMESFDLGNPKGRTRTCHENKLIVSSIRMVLSIYLDFIEEKKYNVADLTWTNLESLIFSKLEIKEGIVNKIRRDAFDEGLLLIEEKEKECESPVSETQESQQDSQPHFLQSAPTHSQY